MNVKVIGLTGRMGSGKTTVASFFKELNYAIINADSLAKTILQEEETIKEIYKNFGKQVFNKGKIIPSLLGRIAFQDKTNTEKLNQITHPKIKKKFFQEVNRIKEKKKFNSIIYDAPLLLEAGAYKKMDKVILVITDYNIILQRWKKKIKKETVWKEEDLKQRIARQINPEEAKKFADFIVDGGKSLEGVKNQVLTIHQKLQKSSP